MMRCTAWRVGARAPAPTPTDGALVVLPPIDAPPPVELPAPTPAEVPEPIVEPLTPAPVELPAPALMPVLPGFLAVPVTPMSVEPPAPTPTPVDCDWADAPARQSAIAIAMVLFMSFLLLTGESTQGRAGGCSPSERQAANRRSWRDAGVRMPCP